MQNYSFLNTLVLINGVEVSGYDEGDDVIVLARRNNSANDKVGADGEMTVAISADRSGTVTFRLMQGVSTNAYLGGLITAQENGLFVPTFIQFKDLTGGALGSGTQGYIPKPADMTRGVNPNPQEWVVVVERLDLIYTLQTS